MNKTIFRGVLAALPTLLLAGCLGNRYVSADADLESIYKGKSYYEVVADFGRPNSSSLDEHGATNAVYNSASLIGTSAEWLYKQYVMRNRNTKETGTPTGMIRFLFDSKMKCSSVKSDFQHEKVQAPPEEIDWNDEKHIRLIKPIVPRSIEFPQVKRRSPLAEVISIERIDVEENQTKIYFSYCDRTPNHRPLYDKGLAINGDVFLQDCATSERVKFVKAEGISIYPEYTDFAHNRGGYDMLVYTLVFEALPINTKTIDVVEPGPEGFNFYGVDVRTPMSFKKSKIINYIAPSKPLVDPEEESGKKEDSAKESEKEPAEETEE